MITISAKQKQGFWRCGVFHPFEATEHEDGVFTAGQLAILEDEPMLSVTRVTEPEPEAKKPKTGKQE
jgi:hypothetical protein